MVTTAQVLRQKTVKFLGMDLPVILTADNHAYFPLKALCFACMGDASAARGQRARIQRDTVLAPMAILLPLQTPGGHQQVLCLEARGLGRWINTVEVKLLRPELQDTVLDIQWKLTILAHQVLTGEIDVVDERAIIMPDSGPRSRSMTESQLLATLAHMMQRIGNLEISVHEQQRLLAALLSAAGEDD